MKLKIVCDGKVLNEHSEGGKYYGYSNPFGQLIPNVGDTVIIGGKFMEDNDERNKEGIEYTVSKRIFKAYETWNHSYTESEVILEVLKNKTNSSLYN